MPDGHMNPEDVSPEEDPGGASAKATRELSTIQFPYMDLETIVEVTRTMRDRGGNTPFSNDQLAAVLGHAVRSGAFAAKMHAARMFGLVETVAGKSRVTQLGFDAVDPDPARATFAKAEAFLRVALYKRTYDEYKGKTLPARPHGLERVFVEFGVGQKRAHNARWAFERSARYAGFFEHGEDRLVAPLVMVPHTEGERAEAAVAAAIVAVDPAATVIRHSGVKSRHSLIEGLFEKLPDPDAKWGAAERVRWLRLAASMFDVLYVTEDGTAYAIEVKAHKENLDGKID